MDKQKPVAWMYVNEDGECEQIEYGNVWLHPGVIPLYAGTKIPEDVFCKTHPDAPHGFDRTMSHSLDRYVCECEYWEPSEHWEPTDNETNAVKGLYKDDYDTGR